MEGIKRSIIPVLLMAALSIGCTQNKSGRNSETSDRDSVTTSVTADQPKGEGISVDGSYCYLGVIERDSVFLEIQRTGNSFNGFLFYNRYQTDSSIGEYHGTISGDTLKGMFDFMSEGMISNIEKYFLLEDNKLKEGIGAFIDKDDYTLVFDDPSALEYGKTYTLELTDCKPEFISQKDKEYYYNLKK